MKDLPPTRPVYLLGESFGGLLATAVAAERPDLVDRLILVNPATSFPRSMWPTLGPLLPSVPTVCACFAAVHCPACPSSGVYHPALQLRPFSQASRAQQAAAACSIAP